MATEYEQPIEDEATRLAIERTYLAYERTLMAWTRTSVSLITFGFTLYKFFETWNEREPGSHPQHILGARTIGMIMIGIGILTLLLATLYHYKRIKELARKNPYSPKSLALLLSLLIVLLGMMAFLSTILR